MWQVFWRWPFYNRKPDFSKTLVTYKITVHFPSWEDLRNADPALQDEYTRYIKAMAGHEKGHLDNILQNYKKIQDAVVREASKQGPAMNSDIANTVAKAELAKLWELDRKYDKETKHGQKQGVLFPNSAHR